MSKQCKDCVHYNVCEEWADRTNHAYYQYGSYCEQFKDKSRFVELPCKIGMAVYQIDGERIYASTIHEITYTTSKVIFVTENIAFDERAIDNSIFLTREEAVKALERSRDNG